MGEIIAHERSCSEVVVQCRCGQSIPQRTVSDHRRVCPMGTVKCEYCHKDEICRTEMDAHLDVCEGSVPMSYVRKIMKRMDDVEAELGELRELHGKSEGCKRRRV